MLLRLTAIARIGEMGCVEVRPMARLPAIFLRRSREPATADVRLRLCIRRKRRVGSRDGGNGQGGWAVEKPKK
jgi:hypothetical protein